MHMLTESTSIRNSQTVTLFGTSVHPGFFRPVAESTASDPGEYSQLLLACLMLSIYCRLANNIQYLKLSIRA